MSGKKKLDKTFWGMVIILFVYWVFMTESLHLQQIIAGIVVVIAVASFNREMFFSSAERPLFTSRTIFWMLRYFFDLVVSIVKANVQVAMIVLNPRMPISPGIVRFKVPLKKSVNRVLLGNSITLTPGTLTINIVDDEFVVHALTRQHAEDVFDWELTRELFQMEEAEKLG